MSQEKFILRTHQLGCDWEIQYFAPKAVDDLLNKIEKHMRHFCSLFSRFEADSMLSRLNQERRLSVNEEFLALFDAADRFHEKTKGLFNPLATPAHFGYTKNFDDGQFTSPSEHTPNFNWHEIRREAYTISLAPGQILDFGGIGKGYLVDELAALLHEHSSHFMINGGGDVWAEGAKPDGTPWLVAVEVPYSEDILGVIPVSTGAVATSGPSKRYWGQYHHLIDSRSKAPVKNIPEGMTVTASSACLADVGATTLICADPDEYAELAKRLELEYGYFEKGKFLYSAGLVIEY